VLLHILNFEGEAIRCRPARELKAGPRDERGWLIGKPLRTALMCHGWANGVVIGVDDSTLNYQVSGTVKNSPGIVADPLRRIKPDDFVIFISDNSKPRVRCQRMCPFVVASLRL
jgi:hypothetical protein